MGMCEIVSVAMCLWERAIVSGAELAPRTPELGRAGHPPGTPRKTVESGARVADFNYGDMPCAP